MLSALPCGTAVCVVHAAIGFAIVGGWFVLFGWGAASFVVKREPPPWYWRLLGLLQVLLILQLLAGGILLLSGRRADSFLHYLYGAVFPAIVLVATHVTARRMADEADTWKAFAIAAFFVFGLTLRALTTGLGMP